MVFGVCLLGVTGAGASKPWAVGRAEDATLVMVVIDGLSESATGLSR